MGEWTAEQEYEYHLKEAGGDPRVIVVEQVTKVVDVGKRIDAQREAGNELRNRQADYRMRRDDLMADALDFAAEPIEDSIIELERRRDRAREVLALAVGDAKAARSTGGKAD